jgi:hypothetical protein
MHAEGANDCSRPHISQAIITIVPHTVLSACFLVALS